jgi:flagellar M-ring protein FliF
MAVATQPSLVAQLQNFGQLSNSQKIGFIIAAAAIIALFSGAYLWYQTPSYQILYTNLSEKDGGAVINALQQLNVPFKAEGTSAIKVPMDKVYEIRLKLAAQGIPKGGASFDLLDNQKLGVSQFVEQVNYQRALEGELARTIEAISVVQGARVHLAIPRPSVFLRDQQKPSASVFLNLGGGKHLDPAQVSGIVHLVSSSVADLPAQNITVVDQSGNLLIAPDVRGDKAGLDPTQLEYLNQIESSFVRRIESIVAAIVGNDNVRAQVTADLDFSQTEQTAESYKPNPTPQEAAIRSQQTSDNNSGSGVNASGVPGALSNQPPGAASAPITAPATGAAGAAATTGTGLTSNGGHRDATVNYELDKTIKHTKLPVGNVKRLSAAVVVNYKKKTAEDGKVSFTPLTAAELTQINNLVKEAMGFNQPRGDSLNVVNAAFNLPAPEKVEEISFWEKPKFEASAMAVIKFIAIAIVIWLLVFRILVPILRQLAIPPAPLPMADTGRDAMAQGRENAGYQDNLQAARQLARQDPKVVANVVKEWVGGGE